MSGACAADAVFVLPLQLGGEGFRVGVKDSIDIAGFPTRMGSAAYADAPPAAQHAVVVQGLLAGGCRIVGKTNLHELAYGVTGINGWTGTPLNPLYPDRVPGGSSSGSAVAVAAQRVDFAIGTDTGGSIRVPAACCGIVGLKPTYGRVSRTGVHPATSSLDSVGPFARDLAMLERAMTLIDPTFAPLPPPAGLRVGLLNAAADPTIGAVIRDALQGSALEVTPVSLPGIDAAFRAGITLISAEMWTAFGHLTESKALGADVQTRLLAARGVSPEALAAAEACRRIFRAEVDALLDAVDVLALPTLPDFPLDFEQATDASAALRSTTLVRPFNLTGHPALSLPLKYGRLPVGLQLVGRHGGDAALCAAAHRLMDHRTAPSELL